MTLRVSILRTDQEVILPASNEKPNVLFICSRNQWRSPTAEQIFRKHPLMSVRSAGTSPNARRKVSADDIHWADVIFVMEEKHKSRLISEFLRLLAGKTIHVLDIPDEYKYMDPELVEQLESSVGEPVTFPLSTKETRKYESSNKEIGGVKGFACG